MRAIFAAIILSATLFSPAHAATTVFGASVFSTSGTVIAQANGLGAADGLSTTILRVAGGSRLVLQFGQPITGAGALITGLRLTPGTNVQIAVGEVIGGVATFSANTALPAGLGPNFALNLMSACSALSPTNRCSLLRITVNGAPGSGFALDGVLGVTPEPSVWGLMLLGFGATTWRLKNGRKVVVRALA